MNFLKLIFVIATLLIGLEGYGQTCKFHVDKIDEITNERMRSIQKLRLGNMSSLWWIFLEQKGVKFSAVMHIFRNGKSDEIVAKGSKLFVKLENGKILELVFQEDFIPSYKAGPSTGVTTTWDVNCGISKEQMQQLSESEIVFIRLKIGTADVDAPEASGKTASKIMEAAQCFLKD